MLEVIHYTKDPNFTLKEIIIRNGYKGDGLHNKPLGGLWCSPSRSKYGWEKWCRLENYRNSLKDYTQIILKISRNNMLVIDSKKDLDNLPILTPREYPIPCIDFEALVKKGTDSIHLTEKGIWETRHSHPIDLYPWDCETVLIMNNKCIRSISTPIYTQHLPCN